MEQAALPPTVVPARLELLPIAPDPTPINSNTHFLEEPPWEPIWNGSPVDAPPSDIEECSPVEAHPGDTEDSFREGTIETTSSITPEADRKEHQPVTCDQDVKAVAGYLDGESTKANSRVPVLASAFVLTGT